MKRDCLCLYKTGNVVVGSGTSIGPFVSLHAGKHGSIRIGPGCNIKAGARLVAYGGSIVLGARVSVGENSVVYGHGSVQIGESVAIGPLCFIGSQEHIRTSGQPNRFTGELVRDVIIDDGALISASCVITAGVTIGRYSFIGAGSLVFRNVEAGMLAYGSPAKCIDRIGPSPLYGWSGYIDEVD
jgi:acetyltransferase-like isoleucine patch superfamily enzyme